MKFYRNLPVSQLSAISPVTVSCLPEAEMKCCWHGRERVDGKPFRKWPCVPTLLFCAVWKIILMKATNHGCLDV